MKNIIWLPKTLIGKKALRFALFTVLWGILIPTIPFPSFLMGSSYETVAIILFGPPIRLLILVILAVMSFIYSKRALFKEKDRSVLGWICFSFLCLTAAFWTFFIIGEFTVPH
jgi:uncharacterized membrane protein (DUF485 family)